MKRETIVVSVSVKPLKNRLRNNVVQLSTTRLTIASDTPITGDSQKIVAAGLSSPIFLFLRRTCVRLQRKPPDALAERTRMRPERTKWVSVATIRRTPIKMRKMTPTRRYENFSRRKRKAKRRTKIREEDLHMAVRKMTVHVN